MKKYENDYSNNFHAEVEGIRFCQNLLSKTWLVILDRPYWFLVIDTAIFSSLESTEGSVGARSRLFCSCRIWWVFQLCWQFLNQSRQCAPFIKSGKQEVDRQYKDAETSLNNTIEQGLLGLCRESHFYVIRLLSISKKKHIEFSYSYFLLKETVSKF